MASDDNRGVEIIDDALVEAIELSSLVGQRKLSPSNGVERSCNEGVTGAFEELEEDQAD
jgi:hypothetical protein